MAQLQYLMSLQERNERLFYYVLKNVSWEHGGLPVAARGFGVPLILPSTYIPPHRPASRVLLCPGLHARSAPEHDPTTCTSAPAPLPCPVQHIEELLPVLSQPTIGQYCQGYSLMFRRWGCLLQGWLLLGWTARSGGGKGACCLGGRSGEVGGWVCCGG